MVKVEQIPNEKLLDHIKEPDVYMVTFTEKTGKPNVTKISTAKLNDVLSADCYIRFIDDGKT